MSDENSPANVVRRWYQGLWNDDDITTVDRLLAEPCCIHGLSEQPVRSCEEFKGFYRQIGATFSNLTTTVDRVTEEGNAASGMVTVTATHTKSGASLSFEVAFFVECDNGKITQAWNVVDWVPLLLESGTVAPETFASAFGTPE